MAAMETDTDTMEGVGEDAGLPLAPQITTDAFDTQVKTILKRLLEKEKQAGINGQKIVWCFIYKTPDEKAGVIRLSLSSEGTLSDYGIDVKHDAHDTSRQGDAGRWAPIEAAIDNGLLPIGWGTKAMGKNNQFNETHAEWSAILAQAELKKKNLIIWDDQKKLAYIEYIGKDVIRLYNSMRNASTEEEKKIIQKEIIKDRQNNGWGSDIFDDPVIINQLKEKRGKYRKMFEKVWAHEFPEQAIKSLESDLTPDELQKYNSAVEAAVAAAGVAEAEDTVGEEKAINTIINELIKKNNNTKNLITTKGIVFDHGTDQGATDTYMIEGAGDGTHLGMFYDGGSNIKKKLEKIYPSEEQYKFCGQAVFVVGGGDKQVEGKWGQGGKWENTSVKEQVGYSHAGQIGLIRNRGQDAFGPLSNQEFKKRMGPDFILYVLGDKSQDSIGMRGNVLIKPMGDAGEYSEYPFNKINSTLKGVAGNEWYDIVKGIDEEPYKSLQNNQELTAIIKYFADRSHGTAPIAKAVMDEEEAITFGTHDRAAWAALSYILAYDLDDDDKYKPITESNVDAVEVISDIQNAKNLVIPTVLITPHSNIITEPEIRGKQSKRVMLRARTALPIKDDTVEMSQDTEPAATTTTTALPAEAPAPPMEIAKSSIPAEAPAPPMEIAESSLPAPVPTPPSNSQQVQSRRGVFHETNEAKKETNRFIAGKEKDWNRAKRERARRDRERVTKKAPQANSIDRERDDDRDNDIKEGGKRKRRTKKHHKRRTRNGPKKYTKNNKKKGKKQRKYNKKKPKQRKTNRKTHRKNKKLNKNRRKTRRSR